jgi:hypothetical protein
MATNALLTIEEAVTRYMLKYKKSQEDFIIFTEHVCNLYRDFRLHDSNQVVTSKVDIDANRIIEMPDDMLSFVDLLYPSNGQWISFTEMSSIVNTTTFTGLVEGRDSDFGEGQNVPRPEESGYGGRGAINAYNYVIDWEARRIFVEGIESDTVALKYISSGVETTGETNIPDILTPMIDSYLLWKESFWVPELRGEREQRKRDFMEERFRVKNLINAMGYEQWRDVFLGLSSQAPIR